MKIVITESQLKRLFKEDIPKPIKTGGKWLNEPMDNRATKPGEKWFHEPKNFCLKNHRPPLQVDGVVARLTLPDGVSYMSFEEGGLFTYVPKPYNPEAHMYNDAFLKRTGKWRCNTDTGKIQTKIDWEATKNRIAVFNGEPVNMNTQNKIPQAKTMNDVKNGKGFIIYKMQGEHVRELQKKLIELDYNLGPRGADGVFGEFTFNAIEKFQMDNNIVPKNNIYGNFGKITYEKLSKVLQNKGLEPIKSK